jgi:hypothetical protein
MNGRKYGIFNSEVVFAEALVSSEYEGDTAHGLILLFMAGIMHTEIDRVDVYLAYILIRAPDLEVV